MALVLADRVKVTTTTTGTGTVALGAAQAGYQDFSVLSNGDTTYYCIADNATGAWEVGLGTYASAGPSLARTSVIASSTGTAVSFGAGPKDVFITLPAERVVTTDGAGFSGPVTVPALNDGHLAGHRNRIINGDMRIAQRGTSFAAAGGYTLDRWFYYSNSSIATVSRQADAPSGSGFVDSLRVTVTTGDNSIAAGDFALLATVIEGKYVTDLIGKPFTLSFWVRSSRTGTYCVAFGNAGEDRTYIATYSITDANTWQKKTITISGGLITDGTWDWGNGEGVSVTFTLASGSSLQTTPGEWRTGSYLSTSTQQNAINEVGNIFAITGVQLEPGTVATPFERRINELELCQRYARLNSVTTGWSTSTTGVVVPAYFDKPMREVPSATLTNGVGALYEPGASLRDITSIDSASLTASGGYLTFTTPTLIAEKPHLLLPERVLFSADF